MVITILLSALVVPVLGLLEDCGPSQLPAFLPNRTGASGDVEAIFVPGSQRTVHVLCCHGFWGAWPLQSRAITSVIDTPGIDEYVTTVDPNANPSCPGTLLSITKERQPECEEGQACILPCLPTPSDANSCVAQPGLCQQGRCRSRLLASTIGHACRAVGGLPGSSLEGSCAQNATGSIFKCCDSMYGLQTQATLATPIMLGGREYFTYTDLNTCLQDPCPLHSR